MIAAALGWLLERREVILISVSAASLLMLAISAIGLPWFLARLPSDYFARVSHADSRLIHQRAHPMRRLAKNALGAVLAIAGIAMLFLPGQGLLTLVVALTLLEFPGKARLQRRLLDNEAVFGALNWVRRRASKPPFSR